MRISYGPQIFMAQEYGGISRYYYELASRVSKKNGFDVKVVAPIYINNYIKELDVVLGTYTESGSRLNKCSTRVNQPLSSLINKFLSPDVVHDTYYHNCFSSRFKAFKKHKSVVTVYDMIHEKFSDQFPPVDRTSVYKKMSVDNADHVICISNNTKNDLVEHYGISEEKISVIYLSSSLPNVDKKVETPKPFIFFVGLRGGYKNFNKLVEVYALSEQLKSNFALNAFGGGPWTSDELAQFMRYGLGEQDVFHVNGDDTVLASYYLAASCFVCPSLYEGFGIPPLEAMISGCPVACSGTSSLPEVVGDAALIFDPESVESMTDTIEKILFDESCRRSLVSAGRVQAGKFSWDRCADETIQVYSELVKS